MARGRLDIHTNEEEWEKEGTLHTPCFSVPLRTAGAEDPEAEVYKPVRCNQCNTEVIRTSRACCLFNWTVTQVAVYDNDEIYHFFNVAPTCAQL